MAMTHDSFMGEDSNSDSESESVSKSYVFLHVFFFVINLVKGIFDFLLVAVSLILLCVVLRKAFPSWRSSPIQLQHANVLYADIYGKHFRMFYDSITFVRRYRPRNPCQET